MAFMSVATTGINKSDKVIAVFVGKESGPVMGLACEGITGEELGRTYKYHRISRYMYDNLIQVSPQVLHNSICNFCTQDLMISYNPKFVQDMLKNMTGLPDTPHIVDICKVCQWAQSGQIFNTIEDANLGKLLLEMSNWKSPNRSGIKHTIELMIPDYVEDLSRPAPESMVEALRCLCKSLERIPVRISQGL